MKFLLAIISILFFTACKNNKKINIISPPENSKTIIFKLADSLGNVTIQLPIRYDSLFSWTHYSDCGKPCDKIKYRSQPKSLPVTKESGWIWVGERQDSIERFTIIHSGYFPFYDNDDTSYISQLHQHHKENRLQNPDNYKIKSDTIEKIGDRFFSIIAIDLYDTAKAQFSKKLLAATTIKNNTIYLNFELLKKENNSATEKYIENCKYFLRTVQLSMAK